MLQLPEPSAVAVPNNVVPLVSYNLTVLLASAVPVKTGVLLLVMLSVLDVPVSEATVKSGVLGALGGVVSATLAVRKFTALILANIHSFIATDAEVVPAITRISSTPLNAFSTVEFAVASNNVNPDSG